MLLIIGRTIKEAFNNFTRNGWLSLAAVTVMFLSVFVIGALFVMVVASNGVLKDIQNRMNISIYFKPDVAQERITEIKNELSGYAEIQSVEYISKEQALEIFKKNNANVPDVINSLDELGGNPLLASLVVKANNSSQYDSIAKYVADASFKSDISKINYGKNKEIIDRLNSIIAQIKKTGLIVVAVFVGISILIIFNTIRITIYTHKSEIEVMRLVGASNTFIRLPFIFEGIIYGLIAVVLSSSIIFLMVKFLVPRISNAILAQSIQSSFMSDLWIFLLVQLLAGVVLGVISSAIAVRKYLKV